MTLIVSNSNIMTVRRKPYLPKILKRVSTALDITSKRLKSKKKKGKGSGVFGTYKGKKRELNF